jgi:glycosyltransferase involved in cell wall biosynthesis
VIRILAFLEATTVTGPAKNLVEFHRQLQKLPQPPVHLEIATFQRGNPDNEFTRTIQSIGIPLHRVQERSAFDAGVLGQIKSLLSQLKPDIVQTHAIKSHFLLRLSGEYKTRPWIAFHHGYTFTSKRLLLYNRLDRWSLRAAQRVLTVNKSFAKDLISQGIAPGKITVLHNAIDPAWGARASDSSLRARTRRELGLKDIETVLLIVGRLSLEKSHVLLVQAMARLGQLLPEVPVRLLIVGDGPEKSAVEQAAQSAGCLEQIVFIGHTPDVLPYYAAADIAVLASRTEGSPNSLLEAMVASLPIVATNVGGIPEIATPGETALLIPPDNVENLASALAQTITQPEESKAMGRRAHAAVLEHFTPEHRAQVLCDFYASSVAAWDRSQS